MRWAIVCSFALALSCALFPAQGQSQLEPAQGFGDWLAGKIKNLGGSPDKTSETGEMLERLRFAGEQQYGLLKDSVDHVSNGYALNPTDGVVAQRWLDEDKAFWQRRSDQVAEIAAEYAPEPVQDAKSLFDLVRESGDRIVDYVSGFGADQDDWDTQESRYESRAALRRERQAAEDALRRADLQRRLAESSPGGGASGSVASVSRVESAPERPPVSASVNRTLIDPAQLAAQLGISQPADEPTSAADLETALGRWEQQERARLQEEERRRVAREEEQRLAAEDRRRRADVLRQMQIESESAAEDTSGGFFDSVAGVVVGTALETYITRETGLPAAGIFVSSDGDLTVPTGSSVPSGQSTANDECPELRSAAEEPAGNGICSIAREMAARMSRIEASCPSAAATARDLRLQYERQAAAVCVD